MKSPIANNLLQIVGMAMENSAITFTDSQLKSFVARLMDEEVYLISNENCGVLFADGKFTDQIEFICMNGYMVQINLKEEGE